MTGKHFKLWELAGADPARVFSPYVWKVRLVLAHKNINYESIPWRYADKPLIAPSQKVLTTRPITVAQWKDLASKSSFNF